MSFNLKDCSAKKQTTAVGTTLSKALRRTFEGLDAPPAIGSVMANVNLCLSLWVISTRLPEVSGMLPFGLPPITTLSCGISDTSV